MPWTQEDVDRHNAKLGAKMPAHMPAPQKSKYKNVRTNIGGEVFDSKREAEYWLLLKARVEQGEISSLQRQVKFPLYAPVIWGHGPDEWVEVSSYVADYVYRDKANNQHVVDAKGKKTQMYLLKKKWLELQDDVKIEEV